MTATKSRNRSGRPMAATGTASCTAAKATSAIRSIGTPASAGILCSKPSAVIRKIPKPKSASFISYWNTPSPPPRDLHETDQVGHRRFGFDHADRARMSFDLGTAALTGRLCVNGTGDCGAGWMDRVALAARRVVADEILLHRGYLRSCGRRGVAAVPR